jgi:hypothetical protein
MKNLLALRQAGGGRRGALNREKWDQINDISEVPYSQAVSRAKDDL